MTVDNVSFQVRQKRVIVIPNRGTFKKEVVYCVCDSSAHKIKSTMGIRDAGNATIKAQITQKSDFDVYEDD